MQRLDMFLALAATLGLTSACGASQPRETTTTVTTTTVHHGGVLRVRLNDEIRAACPGVATPTFDFDSADVSPQHRESLRPLAECMNLPANQSRHFVLVGHTDPAGTPNYNAQLGMDRATSIRDVLVAFGVAADRVEPVSRGEMGAQGTPTDEWPAERRVEIEFAPAATP